MAPPAPGKTTVKVPGSPVTGRATIRELEPSDEEIMEGSEGETETETGSEGEGGEEGSEGGEEGSEGEEGEEGEEGGEYGGEGDELTDAVNQLASLFVTEEDETVAEVQRSMAESLDRLARLGNEHLRLLRAVLGVDKNGMPVRPVGVLDDLLANMRRIGKAADAVAKATA